MWDRWLDVAYAVAMSRLAAGDLDGATLALRLVEADAEILDASHVRRGFAQIELLRGELDEAARYLNDSPDAALWERVLMAKLTWQRGERVEALRRARDDIASWTDFVKYYWPAAGDIQQLARICAEAGDTDTAEEALRAIVPPLADAPPEHPLHTHQKLLEASVMRLRGTPGVALVALDSFGERLQGQALAEWHRERARALMSLGRPEEATDEYERSIAEFDRLGTTWEAQVARREAEPDP